MQPLLRLPRMRDDGGRLVPLATPQIDARLRAMPVAPRRLHEHVATVAVARLRDRAEALRGRRSRLRARRAPGSTRAARVVRSGASRRSPWRAPSRSARRSRGSTAGGAPSARASAARPAAAICRSSSSRRCSLYSEERVILAIDEPVVRGASGEPSVVKCWSHLRCGVHQLVPSRKTKPAPGEELEDVVPRLEDLALERLAAPDDVAYALVGLARDPHRGELAGAIEAG